MANKKKELKQDPDNLRIHDLENMRLIEKSFSELGAGRSGLADADGYMIAGNASLQIAEKTGKKIKVIESDGDTYFVIKRNDLKQGDKKRKELAVADNSTTDTSTFDFEAMKDVHFQEIDFEEWGVTFEEAEEEQVKEKKDLSDSVGEKYEVCVECVGELQQEELFLKLTNEGYKCRVLIL